VVCVRLSADSRSVEVLLGGLDPFTWCASYAPMHPDLGTVGVHSGLAAVCWSCLYILGYAGVACQEALVKVHSGGTAESGSKV